MDNFKHGMSKTPTYNSWRSMIQRCLNKNHKNYTYYRNKKICKKWLVFSNFFKDMGERPANTTLDRIDDAKGYNKKNCRWASARDQNKNRKCFSSSGQKHIYKINVKTPSGVYTYFQLEIKRLNKKPIRRSFKSKDLAILFRQQALKEIGE